MMSQNPAPLVDIVRQVAKARLMAVLPVIQLNQCPDDQAASSVYSNRNTPCDVCNSAVSFQDVVKQAHTIYSSPKKDTRIVIEPKNHQSAPALFRFQFPSITFCQSEIVVNDNNSDAFPRLFGMDHADSAELIEAMTRLDLMPQTEIVRDAESQIQSELIARRALA